MEKKYRIGILGGMGPSAGILLQKLIIDNTPAKLDQDHIEVVCFTNPHIPDRNKSLRDDGGEVYSDVVVDSIKVLEKTDVDLILIPCNTSHARFEKIQRATKVPLLNMIDLTLRKIGLSDDNPIGLLATDGALLSKVFQKGNNINWIIPEPSIQREIMGTIYDIKSGKENDEAVLGKIKGFVEYLKDKNCAKIVLGCTELSMYYRFFNDPMIIDSLTELAQEAVSRRPNQ